MFEEEYSEELEAINQLLNKENASFDSIVEGIIEIVSPYKKSSDILDFLLEPFWRYIYNHMKKNKVDPENYTAMCECIFKNIYSGYLEYGEDYFKEMYYNTLVERVSSEEIVLASNDIMKANEYIDRACEYCAYYLAKVLMSNDFLPGTYTSEEWYEYISKPNGYISRHDSEITNESIMMFINLLKNKLIHSLKNSVTKNSYIQILGDTPTSFQEKISGKKIEYKLGTTTDGLMLMSIDNEPNGLIKEAMVESGIEGMFSKKENKAIFFLNNGKIYRHSMNSEKSRLIASIVTDEKLNELKEIVSSTMMLSTEKESDKSNKHK